MSLTLTDKHKKQISLITQGQKDLELIEPATIKNGIKIIDPSEEEELTLLHNSSSYSGRVMKFVPSSGAATRMSRKLISFFNSSIYNNNDFDKLLKNGSNEALFVKAFIEGIEKFAFYEKLKKKLLEVDLDISKLLEDRDYKKIFEFILSEEGLNLAKLPKALLEFHSYNSEIRTAFEEHIIEAIHYSLDYNTEVRIHFTIPESSSDEFQKLLIQMIDKYKSFKLNIDFSFQKESTNTIAVDINNNPIIQSESNYLLRPGGHGALLENLNDIKGDLIFIKNVDNVLPDCNKRDTYKYKRLLAGLAIKIQKQIFYFINLLRKGKPDKPLLGVIEKFIEDELNIRMPEYKKHYSIDLKSKYLLELLNRPLRVCGMVENKGEPGGGPFWVKNESGEITLQIIEQSQILGSQKHLLKDSTHFNPVDLVCAVRDYMGKPFDLLEFRDESTYFVSQKSYNGMDIKALEHPGLWNGGMANWNTVFVEVPITTFAPVKEVNDLLRPAHQNI